LTNKRCWATTGLLVRERGLEPPRPCGHYDLNVARLPVPPLAHNIEQANSTKEKQKMKVIHHFRLFCINLFTKQQKNDRMLNKLITAANA
jgi:hypothetical protein